MKLLLGPPSCSSSSPNSTSFDANIYSHRSGGSSAGCVFGVLRRLLCPTRPSQNLETCSVEEDSVYENTMKNNYEKKQIVDAGPGIVARLMGLDSLPERITRSRSLNSMDQNNEKDESPKLHRRVKTSMSFREMPTYLDLEDDEFIVLRFDEGRRDNGSRSRRTRSETGIEDLKQGGSERNRNRVKRSSAGQDATQKQTKPCQAKSSDGQTGKLSRTVKYNYKDESCDEIEWRRKKRSWSVNKKVAVQSDSEESSPVSIFDFHTYQETETPTSADDDSWNRSSTSSMVSSPEPDNSKISTKQKTEAVECRQHALLNKTTVAVVLHGQKNSEMWGRIFKLTVAEIIGADWADKDVKDLAAEFEVQIMDQLMNELVHLLH